MKLGHIPWLICVVLVGALAFYFWKEGRATEALLSVKNKALMEANLELGRAKTTITTQKKAHATAMANLDKLWKEEIEARKGAITAYGELEMLYRASQRKGKTLNRIIAKLKNEKGPIEIEVPDGELFAKASDGTFTPIAELQYTYEDFRIKINGEYLSNTLKYDLKMRFKAQFVASKLPTGATNHYAKVYEVGPDGKELDEMELVSFEVIKAEDLPNRFSWFNPKLDLMVGGGLNARLQGSWIGEIGFSVMSYGKTPDDLMWRFLRVGNGLTRHGYSLTFSPAQLNIGEFLPVISNTWLVPFAGYDFGAMAAHGGLGISLVF
jgi:hypothetical protein